MSTLYRLKAYFGMVPAEDMDAYLDYDDQQDFYEQPAPSYPRQRVERSERPLEHHVGDRHSGYQAGPHRVPSPHSDRAVDRTPVDRPLPDPITPPGARLSATPPPAGATGGSGRSPLVRGALAVDPTLEEPPPAPPVTAPPSRAESPASTPLPMSRITTVHPRSYNEARTIGERYRDGIPVIINLTELDDAAAKRLVDFAAGLAFALRGSIDKITSRVFLLSPSGVDVSAEDRRRLAEGGFFSQD
ncbi:MAG TPA: cell division protein SepF [Pseudonocardia sp.]|jgi:cell division inhibitor SepF